MTRRRNRVLFIRDDGQLLDLLDQRIAEERASNPGRQISRESYVRERLYAILRWLSPPGQ